MVQLSGCRDLDEIINKYIKKYDTHHVSANLYSLVCAIFFLVFCLVCFVSLLHMMILSLSDVTLSVPCIMH